MREMTKNAQFWALIYILLLRQTVYSTRPQEKPAALCYMFLLVGNFGVAVQITLLGEQRPAGYCPV